MSRVFLPPIREESIQGKRVVQFRRGWSYLLLRLFLLVVFDNFGSVFDSVFGSVVLSSGLLGCI